MRLKRITLTNWRGFQDTEISIPETAVMVCLVGGNGSGKSQMLEFVASAAHSFGLSEGTVSRRIDPSAEEDAAYSTVWELPPGSVPNEELLKGEFELAEWDRTITVTKEAGKTGQDRLDYHAGGSLPGTQGRDLALRIGRLLRKKGDVNYLFLDASRSLSEFSFPLHELAQAQDREWEASARASSHLSATQLHNEWIRYLVGYFMQSATNHANDIVAARTQKLPEPTFVDPLEGYRLSLNKVLPHLLFMGIDIKQKKPLFQTYDTVVEFPKLSGGEKELAFLIGQVERFRLRNGILLIDEPELHLNNDLLRSFVGHLKASIEIGQMWMATHSMEVAEIVGPSATFLLDRVNSSEGSRLPRIRSLEGEPLLSTLSLALGTPAFSIANSALLAIEGRSELGERERLRLFCKAPDSVKIFEGGSCGEVLQKVANYRLLATEAGQPLRLGAIIDGDFRSKAERTEIASSGVHVLAVHEVENFLIHPPTLEAWCLRNGKTNSNMALCVQQWADTRAGTWIFDWVKTKEQFRKLPPAPETLRTYVHQSRWSTIHDGTSYVQSVMDLYNIGDEHRQAFQRNLKAAYDIYARKREDASLLWKICEGKEVFKLLCSNMGFQKDADTEVSIMQVWEDNPSLVPEELLELRLYVAQL